MRPRLGSKAVGALCLVMAGCTPAVYVGGQRGVPEWVSPAAPCSARIATVVSARASFDEAGDELAPDPFAKPVSARKVWAWVPTAEDDLAPDPFAGLGRESTLQRTPPLAEDDLAPDPFAEPGRPTTRRKSRPVAEDGLAPDPFAEPAN